MTRGESKYIFNDSPAAIPGKWKRTILKRNHDTFDVRYDGFWDNPENSQRVLQKLKQLKNKLESQEKRRASWEDMMVLCEMGNEEEDESLN